MKKITAAGAAKDPEKSLLTALSAFGTMIDKHVGEEATPRTPARR